MGGAPGDLTRSLSLRHSTLDVSSEDRGPQLQHRASADGGGARAEARARGPPVGIKYIRLFEFYWIGIR